MLFDGILKRCLPIHLQKFQSSSTATDAFLKADSHNSIDLFGYRVERFISYVETDLSCHYDDVVTLKFDKIDRKVVPKQHLLQAKTYVFAPSFQQFVRVPSLIAQADVQSVLDTFCAVRAEGGVRWSRSLMGQRFGYELKSLERAVFPEWFPFFIVNVQPKTPGMPLMRMQLVKMSRAGRPEFEYAYPSLYYYDTQDWTCLLRKKIARFPLCIYQHAPTLEDYHLGLFAVPCGDFVACGRHAQHFLSDKSFHLWLSRQRHPVREFDATCNFVCPWCERLSISAYRGLEFERAFRSSSPKQSKSLLSALWSDWIKWLSRSKIRKI